MCVCAGPSLADAGPGARYGVGPPSVRLQWRYGGGGVRFRSSRGAGPGATAPVAPPKGRPCVCVYIYIIVIPFSVLMFNSVCYLPFL